MMSEPLFVLHQGGYKMSKDSGVFMPCAIPANVEFIAVVSSTDPVSAFLLTAKEAEETEQSLKREGFNFRGESRFHSIISKESKTRAMFLAIVNKSPGSETNVKCAVYLVPQY